MLLVGDIHITTAKWERVLEELRAYINTYPHEHEVVFMWDFVYHFSYDRKALLLLFGFFGELCWAGKKVHVIAGNHDRIADHFVYEEAKQTLALLAGFEEQRTALWTNLIFYTEPTFQVIDNQDCLIFPFFHPSFQQKKPLEIKKFTELWESTHRQEQYAAYANELLQNMIDERKSTHTNKKLVVLHHWYIAQTAFPGVIGTFPYKSPALSPHWLDDADIRLISGHIHMPFVVKNYLCVGSSRHTSPLELNQQKRWCVYAPATDTVEITPLHGFPYIVLQSEEIWSVLTKQHLDKAQIEYKFEQIRKEKALLMQKGLYNIYQKDEVVSRQRRDVTLTLQWDSIRYDALHELLDESLLQQLGDVKVKQVSAGDKDMQALLQVWWEELQRRLSSWKELLQNYLQQKYGEKADTYLELLKTLKIL